MTQTSMSSPRPRAVVVGYGFAGRSFHSYLIGLAPGLALHGVVARDPARRQQAEAERGCRTYEQIEQALEDKDVDLIVLATPHATHAPLAIQALSAGKHVVTDKVMCLNLAECDAMIEASRRSGKLLTVFHNRRWDGDYLTLRKAIDEGMLGDVRWIEMAWMRYGAWRSWRASRAMGGGRTYDLGAHLIDQCLTLFTAPVTGVFARMHHDFPGVETESHAQITLSFADGRTAVVDVGSASRYHGKPRFFAIGDKATFVKHGLDPQEAAMIKGDIDAAVEPEPEYGTIYGPDNAQQRMPTVPGRWRSFYENVAGSLTGKAQPAIKLDEMRRLMAVFDAIWTSAQTGQVVQPKA